MELGKNHRSVLRLRRDLLHFPSLEISSGRAARLPLSLFRNPIVSARLWPILCLAELIFLSPITFRSGSRLSRMCLQ